MTSTDMQQKWLDRAQRLYETLLIVLPRDFRARYRHQLARTFRDISKHTVDTGGLRAAVIVWMKMFLELFISAVRERFTKQNLNRTHKRGDVGRARSIGDIMGTTTQNVRLAFRQLRRNPVFAFAAIATLALSIGATTAIFSVLHTVVLRPLPYDAPEELAAVWLEFRRPGSPEGREIVASEPEFLEFRSQTTSFASVSGYWVGDVNLGGIEEPQRVGAASVSADFLSTLGINPMLGRGFSPSDDLPGGGTVTILTHGLWARSFGSDSNVVGQSVLVNGRTFTVIGVLPTGFRFPGYDAQLLRPNIIDPQNPAGRASHYLSMIGRLLPDVSLASARAETSVLLSAWESEFPDRHGPTSSRHPLVMTSLHERLVGNARPALALLSGAVALVLMIACANVAGLLLARAETRQREMAIRTAIGAGRSRLVGQLLTESLVIAVLGGIAGLALANWGIKAIVAYGPADVPRLDTLSLNLTVAGFAALVSITTGIIFGVAPAIAAARSNIALTFKEGSAGATSGKRRLTFRRGLIVSEIAIGLVLAVGAALLIKSMAQLRQIDPGFNPVGVVTMRFSLTNAVYPEAEDVAQFHRLLAERLEATPGVVASGAIRRLPLAGSPGIETLNVIGKPNGEGDPSWNAEYQVVSAGFFQTLGIPVLAGRSFDETDLATAPPVAMVNQRMADSFWPGEEAVGQRVQVGNYPGNENPVMTVIGVTGNVRQSNLVDEMNPQLFVPRQQARAIYGGFVTRGATLAVRSTTDPIATISSVRSVIRELDPNLPLADVQTMQQVLTRNTADERFTSIVMGLFSALALLLGAVGIYGLMAYTVAQQTREIGVRMALGANSVSVQGSVVKQGLRLALWGIGIGLLFALALSRFMSGLVFDLDVRDPVVFGSAVFVLLLTSLLAAFLPARKAAGVDPMSAIRCD